MRWDERPRQRRWDAVDAGYRLSAVAVNVALWSVLLALVLTNDARGPEWLLIMLGVVPLLGAHAFFAGFSAVAWWRELRWRRLAEQAEREGAHATAPLRGAWERAKHHPLRNQDRNGSIEP